MKCPKDNYIDFDVANCKNCEYYADCLDFFNKYHNDSELPYFIRNGVCQKDAFEICNLGYACDACPYNRLDKTLGDNFPNLPREGITAIGKDSEIRNEIIKNIREQKGKISQSDIDDLKIDIELFGKKGEVI
jgi:hypothetical protein